MNVYFDGILYSWVEHGGIVRYFNELYKNFSTDITPSVLFHTPHPTITLPERVNTKDLLRLPIVPLPKNLQRRLYKPLNTYVFEKYFQTKTDGVFHSTYYSTYKNVHIPQITTVHDMTYERFPHLFKDAGSLRFMKQKEKSVRAADQIICISETTRKDVAEYYGIPSEKLHVVYHGVDSSFRPLPQVKVEKCLEKLQVIGPYILFVGQRDRYKNFSVLLDAFTSWKGYQDFTLVVVGGNWSTEEANRVALLDTKKRIKHVGRVNDEQLVALYNGASTFVFPSLYEGFGLPILEAMACNTSVVAADIPAFRELANDQAYFFDPTDTQSLQVSLDDATSHQYDPLSHIDIHSFSWQKTAKQTEAIYHLALT